MYKSELIALLAKSIHEQGDDNIIFHGDCGNNNIYAFNIKSVDDSSDETFIYGEEE